MSKHSGLGGAGRGKGSAPEGGSGGRFQLLATTEAEEQAYDFSRERNLPQPTGVVGSIAHLVKGALGAGVLSGHVGYKAAGAYVALVLNVLLGVYLTYCLYILVHSAQVLYKRTRVPLMSYSDVGEAAILCSNIPKLYKFAKVFRYVIDVTICLDLFGSCATYQLIMAKSVKQLVEDKEESAIEPLIAGYPHLRIYLLFVIPLCVIICLLRYLKFLAPFSLAANGLVVLCMGVVVYYCFVNNPSFSNIVGTRDFHGFFQFCGMCVFSMSCAGIVIPVENNMARPDKFSLTLVIGMTIIVCMTILTSFFGYAAYLEDSKSPITINFPMTVFPKILKFCIVVMIYVTHALNFWAPFNLCFHYLKKLHPPEKEVRWELIYRACIVVIIGVIAIIFPSITALMGFLGTFCLSNMGFIWPCCIELLVIWKRPGLGRLKWRLWKAILLLIIGFILFIAGTLVSVQELYHSVGGKDEDGKSTTAKGGGGAATTPAS